MSLLVCGTSAGKVVLPSQVVLACEEFLQLAINYHLGCLEKYFFSKNHNALSLKRVCLFGFSNSEIFFSLHLCHRLCVDSV